MGSILVRKYDYASLQSGVFFIVNFSQGQGKAQAHRSTSSYHKSLGDICLAKENSSLSEQYIHKTRVFLRRTVVKIRDEAQGCISATDLERVFETDRQPVKRAS